MKTEPRPTYHHRRQTAPLCLLLYAFAGLYFVLTWAMRGIPELAYIFIPIGLLMTLLAACFHYLQISDQGERLAIQFGPLPIFRRTVRYDIIERVEVSRTSLLDGWGIHLSLRGGWVWNLWGYDCVLLHLKGGKLWLGTNDAPKLAAFLAGRINPEGDVTT